MEPDGTPSAGNRNKVFLLLAALGIALGVIGASVVSSVGGDSSHVVLTVIDKRDSGQAGQGGKVTFRTGSGTTVKYDVGQPYYSTLLEGHSYSCELFDNDSIGPFGGTRELRSCSAEVF